MKKPSVLAAASELSLLNAEDCVAAIFPNPKTRPSLRWFNELHRRGEIPRIRVRRRVFFDVAAVRGALARHEARGKAAGTEVGK